MSTVATQQIVGSGELRRLSPRFWLARQTQLALFWGPVFIASVVIALIVNVSAADLLPLVVALIAAVAWLVERGRYRSWGYASERTT